MPGTCRVSVSAQVIRPIQRVAEVKFIAITWSESTFNINCLCIAAMYYNRTIEQLGVPSEKRFARDGVENHPKWRKLPYNYYCQGIKIIIVVVICYLIIFIYLYSGLLACYAARLPCIAGLN
jgi:hypothetical protein